MLTHSTPNIPTYGRAAYCSRRSYFFRQSLACSKGALSLDLLRAVWRVAGIQASRC